MRARAAAKVNDGTRCDNYLRQLIRCLLHERTLRRLVAPPLPRRALAVVHEPKEPLRGRHDGDVKRMGRSTGLDLPHAPSWSIGRGRAPIAHAAACTSAGVQHRRREALAADLGEAETGVEAHRRVAHVDAEAHPSDIVDQLPQQRGTDPTTTMRTTHRDRHLMPAAN